MNADFIAAGPRRSFRVSGEHTKRILSLVLVAIRYFVVKGAKATRPVSFGPVGLVGCQMAENLFQKVSPAFSCVSLKN